ncbi:hypothetical protein HJC23_001865 [Cyclotella cryptica]|uniref:Uncharacterized protein n=1 Tax=Cyclotella cryptica TaxID=29204 RepID=A0ABD3Q0E6_9STRA
MKNQEVATSIASITDSTSQGSDRNRGKRMIRDRLADEKTRTARERKNEYWRSIVPSSCFLGLEEVQADDVFAEVSRRVRRECQYLCLIPPEGFEAPSIDGKIPKAKRHTEWLLCASILVVTSLNLDSPNPIGWEPHKDSFTLSRFQSGEVAPSYWILGAFCRLRGAQPWQATRSYIASKVYELLEAEGWESWITSESRWDALGSAIKPTIEKYLCDSNPDFNDSDSSNLLNDYTREIWKRFASDHLKVLHGQSAALPPIYSLTENYVKFVGAKLEMSCILPGSLLSSAPRSTEVIISELELRSLVTKRVKKLQYDYFPLIQDGMEALQGVCDKVLDRLHTMSHVIHPEDLSNSKLVASILNDLEDESAYLSIINQLFRVRVCLSDISNPSVSSADLSSFLLGSRSSAIDCKSKTNSPIGSINGKPKRSMNSNESNSMGGSAKRSKLTNVESSTKNPCNKMGLHALTLAELREAACGSCILCNPSGKVHCLLGVPYQGNWSEYEVRMRELSPLFSGQEIEMTILHGLVEGNNKRFAETKHLQVIRMFQLEDVIPCFNYLIDLIPNPVTARRLAPKVLRRTLRVVHCLEIRTRELMDTALQVRPSESCENDIYSSFMSNAFCKLKAMKQMLELQMEG